MKGQRQVLDSQLGRLKGERCLIEEAIVRIKRRFGGIKGLVRWSLATSWTKKGPGWSKSPILPWTLTADLVGVR